MAKKKRAKKKAAPAPALRTSAQVLAWIKANVKPYDVESGDPVASWTPARLKAAALWWHANEQAIEYNDLNQKDIASILLAGLPPLSMASMQELLDSAHESEDDSFPADLNIENSLRDFFVAHIHPHLWQDALSTDSKASILHDFREWSGGFEPSESTPEDVLRYVRYARPGGLTATQVRKFLFQQAGFEEDDE